MFIAAQPISSRSSSIAMVSTAPFKSVVLSLLLVLAFSVAKTQAQDCGEPGRARFNENGMPQGYEGELFSATHCFVEGSYCDSMTLPEAARGSKDSLTAFYGPNITTWCTAANTDFSYAFYNLPTFNEPLNWRVQHAENIEYFLFNASSFNQDITGWDVANVQGFFSAFAFASSFNQPLNAWDVGNGDDFFGMFFGASKFDQPLDKWNTSKGTAFGNMFANTPFNQDISMWNVGNGCMFEYMFNQAKKFSQNLNAWGEQLKDKNCGDGAGPAFYYMFLGTACPIASAPPVQGTFCHHI